MMAYYGLRNIRYYRMTQGHMLPACNKLPYCRPEACFQLGRHATCEFVNCLLIKSMCGWQKGFAGQAVPRESAVYSWALEQEPVIAVTRSTNNIGTTD